MAAPETMRARQAALLVHGLPRAARQRVLAKLQTADVGRLQPLLDELAALGVSQALGENLRPLVDAAPARPPSSELSMATAQERAERLHFEGVLQCLQSCAPVTVAKLLRSWEWPWTKQVLDAMPEIRRAEVLQHLRRDSPKLAPAVLASLCERLCAQVAQTGASRSPAETLGRTRDRAAHTLLITKLKRLFGWMR